MSGNNKYYKQYFPSVQSWQYFAILSDGRAFSIINTKNMKWEIEFTTVDVSKHARLQEISKEEYDAVVNEIRMVFDIFET